MNSAQGLPASQARNCQHHGEEIDGKKRRKTSYRPAPSRRRTCRHCKHDFSGHGNKIYCSDKCRRAAAYRRAHPEPVEYKHTCLVCGLGFSSIRADALYCCDSHRVIAQRRDRRELIEIVAGQLRLDLELVKDYADTHGVRSLRDVLRAAERMHP